MPHSKAPAVNATAHPTLQPLRDGKPSIWMRGARPMPVTMADVAEARARFERFAPALSRFFADPPWDGRVRSPLLDFKYAPCGIARDVLVKADHALPMTGSVKARGGVHELLCQVERIALSEGLVRPGDSYERLTTPEARERFGKHVVMVASTGNLGFSVGLVARAFGVDTEVHMSRDAKAWKKERLRRLGAKVVEHACDFNETVSRARQAAVSRSNAYFVDDESSRELLVGYATAAYELAEQLEERGIRVSRERPLFVYLPCGVGGSPGGITFGLKHIFGAACVSVFVEPVGAACMYAALSAGGGREAVHVSSLGLPNQTIADGLAVAKASELVLDAVGDMVDSVVAVTDAQMVEWVGRAWSGGGLRIEPAAAAAFAAVEPFLRAIEGESGGSTLSRWKEGIHVLWTTGGSLLPEDEFQSLLKQAGTA
jgi:D-serine dehydratase